MQVSGSEDVAVDAIPLSEIDDAHCTELVEMSSRTESLAYAEWRSAARALVEAQSVLQAAQERFRLCLVALSRAAAPGAP